MANHASAAKRARQTITKSLRNRSIRSRVKTHIRHFRAAVSSGDKEKAQSLLAVAARELRKAGSKGVYKPAKVSRSVSRLAGAFNQMAS